LLRTVHGFGYAFQWEQELVSAPASHQESRQGWLIGSTAEVALVPGENIIGREGDGVVVVKSSTVSRRHARISLDPSGAVVEDLGSKNGTYVNDQRISAPTPIADGDQVRIGSLLFTFRMSLDQEHQTQASRSGLRLRS
jgi:pSer/pThr/pTyr-binding forkhead associated (FHA) protein